MWLSLVPKPRSDHAAPGLASMAPRSFVLNNLKALVSAGFCSVSHLVLTVLAQQRNPIAAAVAYGKVRAPGGVAS